MNAQSDDRAIKTGKGIIWGVWAVLALVMVLGAALSWWGWGIVPWVVLGALVVAVAVTLFSGGRAADGHSDLD